jgi:hypothetical protein
MSWRMALVCAGYGLLAGFNDRGPALFLLIEYVLAALLHIFGALLDLVGLLLDASRNAPAAGARICQRLFNGLGRLVAQFNAFALKQAPRPLA